MNVPRWGRLAGIVAAMLPLFASFAVAQAPPSPTVLKGGVTTSGTVRAPDICGSMDPRNHPNEDPKTTLPGCADMKSANGCNAPPNWPDAANWKILERESKLCLVAVPRTPQDRQRLANRTIVPAKQITSVYRQCESSPWDPAKLMCEAPPWTPQPQRGGANDGGPCQDGSNGGGPNSTNYYGCAPNAGGPSGPYIGRRPPTGPIPVPGGPSTYPRNRVICQNTQMPTPEQKRQMDENPYWCPPATTPVNDGSNPSTLNPVTPENPQPGQNPTPHQPVKVLKQVLRGTDWEFSLSNGTKWRAPATVKAFNEKYQARYTYYIETETFKYFMVAGTLAQPRLTYGVRILNETFTILRPATQVH